MLKTKSTITLICGAVAATGLALGLALSSAQPARAFTHESGHWGHGGHPHHHGCFVTTSPTNHTRGIRHWRNPCPYQHRKHMNPYHAPHHRLYPHH